MKHIFVVRIVCVEFSRVYLISADSAVDAITIVDNAWSTIETHDTVTCFAADGMNFLIEK